MSTKELIETVLSYSTPKYSCVLKIAALQQLHDARISQFVS